MLNIQMKFEKVLIAFYVGLQTIMGVWLHRNGAFTPAYLVFTLFTLIFFAATHFRDPGYLLVDESRQSPENSEQLEEEEVDIDGNVNKKVKSRYCRICMINQPFRTKHCHECEKCVATFDHHCPWMAICIGQKNRPLFLLFLYCQTFQLFIAAFGICSVAVNKINPVPSELVFGLVLILILSLLLGLAIFQTYLMLSNLTTWELAKWDKIDYMSKCSRNSGSPFSNGPLRNTLDFWIWGFRGARKIWQFESN